MNFYRNNRCVRCDEPVYPKSETDFQCENCGFTDGSPSDHNEIVEAAQEKRGRTLDLVEIADLISIRKKKVS